MLLQANANGYYCAAGDFYIDPWQPVDRALISHAHSDHARYGSKHYLTSSAGRLLVQERVGKDAIVEGLAFGQTVMLNGVEVSFHPAGHILGSSQIRVAYQGEVWVYSGDYKVEPDHTVEPFELVKCGVFMTESTFAMPIYRWCPPAQTIQEINRWWARNAKDKRNSVIFAYALGKAQRVLGSVDASIGPIYVHGSVKRFVDLYNVQGVRLPQVRYLEGRGSEQEIEGALIVAPASTNGTPWLRRFGDITTGYASGWMQVRGNRRRKDVDSGFVLSDHADWDDILSTIKATECHTVYAMHGYTDILARYLTEVGYTAHSTHGHFTPNEED